MPDWVEIYNTTPNSIDVAGWHVRGLAAEQEISGGMPGHSFLTVDAENLLGNAGDTIQLCDSEGNVINSVTFGGGGSIIAPEPGESMARTVDGGEIWAPGSPTKNYTNIPDPLAPSVPIGGNPNESIKDTSQFAFSWQASTDNNPAAIRYELRASQARDRVETPAAWKSGLQYETSLPFEAVDGATDGDWYWQVRAVDSANNKSEWSSVWHVIVDTNGPGIEIHQPGASLYGGPGKEHVPFEASLWDPRGIKSWSVTMDGIDVTAQVHAVNDSSNIYLDASFDGLADGDHTLEVAATDELGHTGQQVSVFSTDKTAPILMPNVEENELLRGVVKVTLAADEAHPSEYGVAVLDNETTLTSEDSALRAEKEGEQQRSGTVLAYDWDTTQLADGTYQLRFFGKDAAGNESVLIRSVIIDNVPSYGGGALTPEGPVISIVDPLLDQLSKQLTQPFITPKAFEIASIETNNMTDQANQLIAKNAKLEVPVVADQNAKLAPVSPSEGGWRVFGVLWYWWLLLGAAIIVTYRRMRRVTIPSVVNESL